MDPNEASDPNQEREDVPFPTQSGPPRFLNTAGSYAQPQSGNGHPALLQPTPQQPVPNFNPYAQGAAPGVAIQQAITRRPVPPPVPDSQLLANLQQMQLAAGLGAFSVAEMWAHNLLLFRQEYQQRTGQTISDRQALDLVLAPLYMALSD